MSNIVVKTYKESLAKTKKRFIGFGRKKAITEARTELKLLYKELKDELDNEYAALIADGLAEIDSSQGEVKSAALWHKKAADDLILTRNDESERLLAIQHYEKCVQYLISAKCEQVASAILFSAIEKLLDGTCQPYVNQYMHDPKLAKSAQVQVAHFVNQIAKIRNDESSARILLKAACFMFDYPDSTKAFINRAMKISNSIDARILHQLYVIKFSDFNAPPELDFDDFREVSEVEMILTSLTHYACEPHSECDTISLLFDVSEYVSISEIRKILVEVIIDLIEKKSIDLSDIL